MHGHRQALLLDVGAGGVGAAQQAGQLALEGGQPLRGPGRDDPSLGGGPALVAVLTEEEELLAAVADGVADLVEPAQGQGLAGRTAGDDGDGPHHVAQRDQHLGRVRVDVGLAGLVDDRREHAVEVEAHHDLPGRGDECVVALARLVGGELHARGQAASAVRMTVRRSIRIGSTAGAVRRMPRSRASSLAAAWRRAG